RHARSMMGEVERMGAELDHLQTGVVGQVRLAASVSAIVQHLPEDLASFLQAHPGVHIELAEHSSAEIVDMLRLKQADLGIFVSDGEVAGLTLVPYRAERLVVIMPAGHPLERRKR